MINKILCVDDDEVVQFLNSNTIKHLLPEIKIDTAANGRAALAFFDTPGTDTYCPEIILLDINMPIMNGWQFLDEFENRYSNKSSQVYIVILSSSIDPTDSEKAKTYASVNKFLSKPLTPEALQEVIDEMQM